MDHHSAPGNGQHHSGEPIAALPGGSTATIEANGSAVVLRGETYRLGIPSAPVAVESGTPAVEPPQAKVFTTRLVYRALKRYWWAILPVWLALSAGLMALAWVRIPPLYQAVAWIEVAAPAREIYARGFNADNSGFFLETQVQLITNTKVLGTALADHPELADLPSLRGAEDLEAQIRDSLVVASKRGTSLIQVAMTSESPTEAADIINAVIRAYLKNVKNWTDQETNERIELFEVMVREHSAEVTRKRTELESLGRQVGTTDVESLRDTNRTTAKKYEEMADELSNVRIRLQASEMLLDRLRKTVAQTSLTQAEIDNEMRDRFYADPRVQVIQQDLERLQSSIAKTRNVARSGNDPAIRLAEQRIQEVLERREVHWRSMAPRLRKMVERDAGGEGHQQLRQAEIEVETLRAQEASFTERLRKVRIDSDLNKNNALKIDFARVDLAKAEESLASVEEQLKQLKYEAKSPTPVQIRSEASPRGMRSINRRLRVMAVVPPAVLLVLLAMFSLVEARAARVADPEELPGRARLTVLGVVPPLPSAPLRALDGPMRPRDELRARREVDAFVQCMDHLRVALYSAGPGASTSKKGTARRCVLITSATGGEGKTTLAANLAYRFANAGLRTLLVDCDLRNPSLSEKLELPVTLGLADVLKGEVEARDVTLEVQGDGPTAFTLLPAGRAQADPSRLLQGEALGRVLDGFRPQYDVILVDAPPVLPVPDALLIGQWTDGAVLAVRHDSSRFPLVERAKLRLANVGVTVLGAVVNGVRAPETGSGQYGYGYGYRYGASNAESETAGTG